MITGTVTGTTPGLYITWMIILIGNVKIVKKDRCVYNVTDENSVNCTVIEKRTPFVPPVYGYGYK